MVIVGRGEEGLQCRQRSSLDRQNSQNSPECAAAADGSTTDADSNATAATAEAEAQSTAHTEAALIRRDLLGNFTEEPVRPLWPSLVQAASTAYYYILPLSAVPTATTAADITASACRREERLRHTQQQQLPPPSPPLKLQWQGNRKPLLGQAAAPAAAVPAQAVPREPRATHQHSPRLPLPLRLSRQRRLRRQQRHRRGRAANSNKKWKKVAANNSLTFDFFNYLAFGPWPLEKGTSDLAEKAEARQEGWPGGGSAGRGAGPAVGRGPRLTLQPQLAAVLLVAKYYQ